MIRGTGAPATSQDRPRPQPGGCTNALPLIRPLTRGIAACLHSHSHALHGAPEARSD